MRQKYTLPLGYVLLGRFQSVKTRVRIVVSKFFRAETEAFKQKQEQSPKNVTP